jgi:hypothetical protein
MAIHLEGEGATAASLAAIGRNAAIRAALTAFGLAALVVLRGPCGSSACGANLRLER